jgi:cell wall-associated NlpC family hydrolase
MAINGVALGALAVGSAFLYSAIKGKSILATTQSIIQGQSPKSVPVDAPITDITAADTVSGVSTSTSPNVIANTALEYVGHCYLYGGSPGSNGKGCWDCSSFANYVIGTRLNASIPGFPNGSYKGTSHGPTTLSWLLFGKSVPGGASAAQPGDLCVWETHMGIAVGGGNMISALNPSLGTKVTSIQGGAPTGEILSVRRLA